MSSRSVPALASVPPARRAGARTWRAGAAWRARFHKILKPRLVVGTAVVIMLGWAGVLAMQLRWSDDRMSVEEVVEALRSGELHQGMMLPVGALPKPWVADAYHARDHSDLSAVYVIRDGEHVVLLYHAAGVLFSACTIERVPTWSETWHFCDTDQLRAHIERSLKSYPRPMLELEEAGADAKQKKGPVLVVWPDGLMALSTAFPRYSPEFRLRRVDAEKLGTALQHFMDQLPTPMPAGASEETVRMALWTAGETTKAGQAVTLTLHILPVCFVSGECPDRLGPEAAAAWERIKRLLEGAAEGGEWPAPAKQHAENYWTDHKPEPG